MTDPNQPCLKAKQGGYYLDENPPRKLRAGG